MKNSPLIQLSHSRLSLEFGLELLYKREFHQVFDEHQSHPEFGPLMVRMKVKQENGDSIMTEDQWDAASLLPSLSSSTGI
jgi:mRNA (guanine-N7-)-methyltransferase